MSDLSAAVLARLKAGLAATTLVCAAVAVVTFASPAHADTAPDPGTPATVAADSLPTVQQDGVVWSQTTVGNTVYATGNFSQTWPAGQTQSSNNQTPRANLLAFDITTGNLIASFNHALNAQGLGVTASPDGSRVYVVGDFTAVDGQPRNHIAAFDTASGTLVSSFHPSISGSTAAVTATNSMVYVGGNFFSVNGVNRTRLASFNTADGSLTSWAPKADDDQVTAIVLSPDKSRVIVGGRFSTLNGVNAYGLGAVDSTSGATLSFAINNYIRDYGNASCNPSHSGAGAGITSLTVDNNQVYGSGFSFYCGNFEGRFAADPNTGNVVWINDCHGDTYDTFPVGKVLYSVGHDHDCSALGAFPDTNGSVWHRAMAETTYPTGGTNIGPDNYGWDYNGQPDASLLAWWPDVAVGSFTHQYQGGWSLTGNSNYLAMGGEFPSVNGVAQHGLTRFAIRPIAPNKVGPVYSTALTPRAVSLGSGTARVAWTGTWDHDNTNLTYKILRDGGSTPVYTVTKPSTFWQLPSLGFTDTGLTPGSTHTYRVQVVDPLGNKTGGPTSSSVTISSAKTGKYVADVLGAGASNYWRLGETSGTTGYDWAGYADLAEGSGVTDGAGGAIAGDSNTAATFDGTGNGNAATQTAIPGPNTFTVEAWIRTTSTSGGKIVGFGNSPLGGTSGNYDRHLYMDNSGHIFFGIYNSGIYTATSPGTYNDGTYHQIVASLSPAGMVLYIDGKKVAANGGTTVGQSFSGYWRVGGDNLGGWPSQPSSNNFNGTIDDVSLYPSALTLPQIQQQYVDAGRTLNVPPSPTDSYGKAVYTDSPDLYWRLDEASGPTAADASPGGANQANYSGGVAYRQPTPVTGASGTGVALNGSDGLIVDSAPTVNPTVYSEEMWFNTKTTQGGKLIGFGDATSGLSSNYDRHVWMLDGGQLEFGVYTGQTNTITSDKSYNDGNWHYLVATQGSDGMKLYVDSQLVGTNPQTQAQNYTGYWRVGGDNTWGGNTSNYFAGTVDEVAVYSAVLSQTQVKAHYAASSAVANQPPIASFTSICTNLNCQFDASASSDPDGTIKSYAWNYGDGTADSGATTNHTFTSAGTQNVTLTVTDNQGASTALTKQVTVTAPPANSPPTAAFTPTCTNLVCNFDASASSDSDGTVASYAWDFGDGSTGTGKTPSHSYTGAGNDTVRLTVTDDRGATGSVSHVVTVNVLANAAPIAAFTPTCTDLTCAFDASASSDPDGTVTGYAWDFGDGSTGTGVTASHKYAVAGDYTVTLTVTDNANATNSTAHVVSPRPPANPPGTPYVSDTFNRSASSGLGTADAGGAWTVSTNAAGQSVAPGMASLSTKAAQTTASYLPSVSTTDTDTTTTLTTDKTASGGFYMDVLGRRVSTSADYRARLRLYPSGAVSGSLLAISGGTQKALGAEKTLPGVTYTPGMKFSLRVQVTGTNPTTVRLKVWPAGTTEPAAWLVSSADTTAALQVNGSVGLSDYLSGVATNGPLTMQVSSFVSRPSVAPPTAAFVVNCAGQSCSADGSGSTDPSGTVSAWQWSWGDGRTSAGATAPHTFVGAGTYRVTLTVTGPSGLTDVTTKTVTLPA